MISVTRAPVPAEALLSRYSGAYIDANVAEVQGAVGLDDFVEAFYASPAFKLELVVVGLLFRKPWSNGHARRLAQGEASVFSAWRVEDRTADQLLMYETISGKTRSWLMVQPGPSGASATTRLYFGSAILPVGTKANGEPRMSVLFNLRSFHWLYSRLLLASAQARLRRRR